MAINNLLKPKPASAQDCSDRLEELLSYNDLLYFKRADVDFLEKQANFAKMKRYIRNVWVRNNTPLIAEYQSQGLSTDDEIAEALLTRLINEAVIKSVLD